MYEGFRTTINGEEVIIPPLSLGQLRNGALKQMQEHDQLVAEGKTYEAIATRADIILRAIRRNYPDFSEEKLLDWLDVNNVGHIWLAVLGLSGFTPGENKAVETAQTGTSSPSTEA